MFSYPAFRFDPPLDSPVAHIGHVRIVLNTSNFFASVLRSHVRPFESARGYVVAGEEHPLYVVRIRFLRFNWAGRPGRAASPKFVGVPLLLGTPGYVKIRPHQKQVNRITSKQNLTFQSGLNVSGFFRAGCVALAILLFLAGFALAAGDVTPPRLVAFDFEPKAVDTSLGPQTITFTARITDDLSGVTDGFTGQVGTGESQVRVRSPNGQIADALFACPDDLVSGNCLDGVYASTLTLPQYGQTGPWQVYSVLLDDEAGNIDVLFWDDLSARGFPHFLAVGEVYYLNLPWLNFK